MKGINKKRGIIIVIIVVLILALFFGGLLVKKDEISVVAPEIKQVDTILLNNIESAGVGIAIAGKVVPEKKVDVVSLSQGTAISSPFNVGDEIELNQVLVYLNSDLVKTSHLNSQINYSNMINNLESVKLTTSETVRQAESGVSNMEQSVNSAIIALEAAEDNLKNTVILQDKAYADQHSQAVISFYSFLNSIESALNQINYIIHVDEGPQLDGIAQTLSARDYQKLNDAKYSYIAAREAHDALKNVVVDSANVQAQFKDLNNALLLTKTAVDDTVDVVNNTVTSDSFSETSLTTQKTAFSTLRSSIVSSQASASSTLDALENLSISHSTKIESLQNAVASAKKNVDLARGNYNNAVLALDSARQAKNQQILIAQASVDSALGQLNLSNNQLAELTIKAPIKGRVTKKLVETGADIRVGQKVAEISQIDQLKIIINLASEDVNKIQIGQEVKINNDLSGIISLIDPSADEVTKKVKVEILFDNKNNDLIAGTFVDVLIDPSASGISGENPNIILIPLKALNISQIDKFVFVAQCDNEICVAKKTSVDVGSTKGKMVEINSGLTKDSRLIVDGGKLLNDGEEVIIKQ